MGDSHKPATGRMVGTRTYASPEQLAGVIAVTSHTDLFSLGIILFEMFFVFGTAMERALVLADLRRRRLPAGFAAEHPHVARLVLALLHERPERRPTAAELLADPFVRVYAPAHAPIGDVCGAPPMAAAAATAAAAEQMQQCNVASHQQHHGGGGTGSSAPAEASVPPSPAAASARRLDDSASASHEALISAVASRDQTIAELQESMRRQQLELEALKRQLAERQ